MTRYARLDFENSQGAASTTAGLGATPFYLPSTEIVLNPKPAPLDRSDELRGIDGLLQLAQNEYSPDGSIEVRGYADILGALFKILFGSVVSTAGDGIITDPSGTVIPTGATRHVFSKLASSTPLSAMLTQCYGSQFIQARGVTLKDMAFTVQEDGVKAKSSLMANYMNRLADPGYTPAYEAFSILPWRRRNARIQTGIGTALVDNFEFTFAQDLEYVRDMGDAASSGFPSRTERANSVQGFLALTGKFTRRDLDAADWDALIAATALDILITMTSEQLIGATTYPYSLFVQTGSAQMTDGDLEGQKNQPRHQQELTWQAGYNEVDTYDFKVTLVNGQANYN